MRLGLLLPPLAGPAAGLAVYVREVGSRLLSRHGDWVVFSEEAAPPGWCDGAETVRLGAGGLARAAGRVHRRAARLIAIQRDLRRELAGRRVDALLVPFHDGVLGGRVPQVIVVHDLTLLRQPRGRTAPARLYMRSLFRRIARRSAALVAVSESTAGDLERTWGIPRDRIRVVHEGFDRAYFRPFGSAEVDAVLARLDVPRPYLFYAGTFARHKNLDLLLTALERATARRPDLRLVVAGPPRSADLAAFRSRARRRGLADRFRSLGYVERSELGPLMAGAAAFVFPSLSEGFGLAVLEAMASGAAVLASDRASLPEVVGDGGILLDATAPEPWADAILELLADPERDRELRRRAVERAQRFDWDTAADQILELLARQAAPRRQGVA